jgi:hypothetical protein
MEIIKISPNTLIAIRDIFNGLMNVDAFEFSFEAVDVERNRFSNIFTDVLLAPPAGLLLVSPFGKAEEMAELI